MRSKDSYESWVVKWASIEGCMVSWANGISAACLAHRMSPGFVQDDNEGQSESIACLSMLLPAQYFSHSLLRCHVTYLKTRHSLAVLPQFRWSEQSEKFGNSCCSWSLSLCSKRKATDQWLCWLLCDLSIQEPCRRGSLRQIIAVGEGQPTDPGSSIFDGKLVCSETSFSHWPCGDMSLDMNELLGILSCSESSSLFLNLLL